MQHEKNDLNITDYNYKMETTQPQDESNDVIIVDRDEESDVEMVELPIIFETGLEDLCLDIFYIFRTQMPNVFKFGRTDKGWKIREYGYNGPNHPSEVLTIYPCDDPDQEERYFKEYLLENNIPSFCGDEFFVYDVDGIYKFLDDYMNKDTSGVLTQGEWNRRRHKRLYNHNKTTDKYKCSNCSKRHGNGGHLNQHFKSCIKKRRLE
tara:strand:+ start:43 stop:663 length:621 start_codon:yes stop_codon:yes gene_type:complete